MRSLRSLVMSRLPVMDIYLVPLGGDDGDSDGPHYDPADLRERIPEESLADVTNRNRKLPAQSTNF